MTFDDGILTVYQVENIAEKGKKPIAGLKLKEQYFYRIETLGVTRYYQAMQASQQVDAVVVVPEWNNIKVTDIVTTEGGEQFSVEMVQNSYDETGLKIQRLTLGKVKENYELPK